MQSLKFILIISTTLLVCIIMFSLFNPRYKTERILGIELSKQVRNVQYNYFYNLGRFDYPKSVYISFDTSEEEYSKICKKINLHSYNKIRFSPNLLPNEIYYLEKISRLTHPKEEDLFEPRPDIMKYENKISWLDCSTYKFLDKSFLAAYFNTKTKKSSIKPMDYDSYLNSYYCTDKRKAYFLVYIKRY